MYCHVSVFIIFKQLSYLLIRCSDKSVIGIGEPFRTVCHYTLIVKARCFILKSRWWDGTTVKLFTLNGLIKRYFYANMVFVNENYMNRVLIENNADSCPMKIQKQWAGCPFLKFFVNMLFSVHFCQLIQI
jgi:hypothetical protein